MVIANVSSKPRKRRKKKGPVPAAALPLARAAVQAAVKDLVPAAWEGIPPLPKRAEARERPDKKRINTRNRFNSWDGAELSDATVAFGRAMQQYLGARRTWTAGEVLDVLMSLGYVHEELHDLMLVLRDEKPLRVNYLHSEHDFLLCVERLTVALEAFKREGRRPFPTWGEVLGVATRCGWRQRWASYGGV